MLCFTKGSPLRIDTPTSRRDRGGPTVHVNAHHARVLFEQAIAGARPTTQPARPGPGNRTAPPRCTTLGLGHNPCEWAQVSHPSLSLRHAFGSVAGTKPHLRKGPVCPRDWQRHGHRHFQNWAKNVWFRTSSLSQQLAPRRWAVRRPPPVVHGQSLLLEHWLQVNVHTSSLHLVKEERGFAPTLRCIPLA